MTRQWYDKPMRIAALQCDYDGYDPLKVLDEWVARRFNVEQLFHPMAASYTAIFDEQRHGQAVRDYIRRAKSRGVRIILYVNVHIIPDFQEHMVNEWAQRGADGSFVKLYETYYSPCINSPWADYFMTVIENVATLDVDGIFLDGPSVGRCCCEHCKRRNGEWFGREAPFGADETEFYTRTRNEFLLRAYRRFKQLKPQALFYVNQPVTNLPGAKASLPEALEYNDILGTEGGFMFYGPPRGAGIWKPSAAAKILEALAPDRPRVVFMAGDQKPWSWYMHAPAETELCMASTVANGANIWYGLHGSIDLLATPGGKAGSEMIRFLADNERYYDQAVSEARVALMYSYATERFYRTDPSVSDFYGAGAPADQSVPGNMTAAFGGFFDLLSRSGIPFDAITDFDLTAEKLKRYDLLILPTAAGLDDECVALIRRFVEAGGNLISNCDTSLYTPDGGVREDFALADVFGVRFQGHVTDYLGHNYVAACRDHPLMAAWDVPLLPAPTAGLDVVPGEEAAVLARFHEPMASRYQAMSPLGLPAVVLNRFGKGASLYLAGTFGELMSSHNPIEYRRLLASAAGAFADSPARLEGGLGNVELAVRRRGRRRIVHLVNYAGVPPRPFERISPQRGLRLIVRSADAFTSARALRSGENCRLTTAGEETIVMLPEVHAYEVVVLE